jgi:hypothetical protein
MAKSEPRDSDVFTSVLTTEIRREPHLIAKGFSIIAAQRLNRTAQGFSPGLCVARIPPCLSAVVREVGRRKKVAAEAIVRLFACYSNSPPNIGCHFQGTFYSPPDPGLKPWAVLFSRCAAKSGGPLRDN